MEEEKAQKLKSDTIQLPEQPSAGAMYFENVFRNHTQYALSFKFPTQVHPDFRVYRQEGVDYFGWMWTIGGVCFVATGIIDEFKPKYKDDRAARKAWVDVHVHRIGDTLESLIRFMEKHLEIMKENIAKDVERYKAGDRTL